MTGIAERLAEVRRRVDAACEAAGRDPRNVELVAVSKTFGADAVSAAFDAGQRAFGENYVQDWLTKADAPALAGRPDLRWHFIGHLQRNKVRFLLGRVACIETVDRPRLAAELSRRADARGARQTVLLQVNLEGEPTKSGFSPAALRESFADLAALPGLRIDGLMAIPPARSTPEATRPDHAALRRLRDELRDAHGVALPTLSSGMSSDFEVAIAEGSTRVRVGTAIFGARG